MISCRFGAESLYVDENAGKLGKNVAPLWARQNIEEKQQALKLLDQTTGRSVYEKCLAGRDKIKELLNSQVNQLGENEFIAEAPQLT